MKDHLTLIHDANVAGDDRPDNVENAATYLVSKAAAAADALVLEALRPEWATLMDLPPKQLEAQRVLWLRRMEAARQDLRQHLLALDRLARLTAPDNVRDEDIVELLCEPI